MNRWQLVALSTLCVILLPACTGAPNIEPASQTQQSALPTAAATSQASEPTAAVNQPTVSAPATEAIPQFTEGTAIPTAPPTNGEWSPVTRVFDGTEMVLVPAGCFVMGSDVGYDDELPTIGVCLDDPYWIDRYEVTITEFTGIDNDHPVQRVNWFEAQAHCEQRGGSLPTEAQWEYAASGPSHLTYPWGETFEPTYVVWNVDETESVGSHPENASWVGAEDMLGNVYEWVSTLYRPYPYKVDDGREDPLGKTDTAERSIRGGAYATDDELSLRNAFRFSSAPEGQYNGIGFRCVRPAGE